MTVINKTQDEFQERIDNSYTIMDYLNISQQLRQKVLKYLAKTNMTREQQKELI